MFTGRDRSYRKLNIVIVRVVMVFIVVGIQFCTHMHSTHAHTLYNTIHLSNQDMMVPYNSNDIRCYDQSSNYTMKKNKNGPRYEIGASLIT